MEPPMTKSHRRTTDEQAKRLLKAFSVGEDGLQHHYKGYRYDRWQDTAPCARLMHAQPGSVDTRDPFALGTRPGPTTAAQRALMTSLGILFDEGAFRFQGWRYDALSDAVHHARFAALRHRSDRN
jgi:hypothetical protein